MLLRAFIRPLFISRLRGLHTTTSTLFTSPASSQMGFTPLTPVKDGQVSHAASLVLPTVGLQGETVNKVSVYLGASQPVSSTHTSMISSLLQASDLVFIFLLRWRPERYGPSADSSALTLRSWLNQMLGVEQSTQRVIIVPLQHDHAGAGLMRSHLGKATPSEVEVCYSNKYRPEKYAGRIADEWMPIYLKEFPEAMPTFLVDEEDPGGEGLAGTGAFVSALAALRDSRTSKAIYGLEEDCLKGLESYRPSFLAGDEWASYVNGLIDDEQEEPFYTGKETKAIETSFFKDPSVRTQLSVSPLVTADEFFDVPRNCQSLWRESLTESTDPKLWERFGKDDALWRAFARGKVEGNNVPPPPSDQKIKKGDDSSSVIGGSTGVVVDCGSGHTSVMYYSKPSAGPGVHQLKRAWFKHADGGNLPITDILPNSVGGAFKGETLVDRLKEFIDKLKSVISGLEGCDDIKMIYIGATGGMREKMEEGHLNQDDVETIASAFEQAFDDKIAVKFEVISGGQEAAWEHSAAQLIWGSSGSKFFPPLPNASSSVEKQQKEIGLFSGGGKSMQLALSSSQALSFPFSTFPKELEERQGAHPLAWLDEDKWNRFADGLRNKVEVEMSERDGVLFGGCFVGTAMNHRAAHHCGISERPITAGEAVKHLQLGLIQFRGREGPLYDTMIGGATPGSSYPLARITAMHTYRLATVLQIMFKPEAQFYFAKNGVSDGAKGGTIDCEWTVGAFDSMIGEDEKTEQQSEENMVA
jgi:hypothetical protein